MSVHKSLVTRNRLKRQRNVLTRVERIGKLEDEGRWTEDDDSVFNLPKVRVARMKRAHTKKKKEEEEAAEGEAAAAPAAKSAAKTPAKS